MTDHADRGVRELRLGIVCYGGVSLAVYMHGITKEVHKLVLASRAVEIDPNHNPFVKATDTSYAYFEALARLDRAGTPLRVIVDTIAGTSAGGINGVYLAKALANYQSLDALRDLWIEKGDIHRLVRGSPHLPLRVRFAELLAKFLLHPTGEETPLRGDQMARWLYDALADMDASGGDRDRVGEQAQESLVPPDQTLDLLVTTTDLRGYERIVETGAGGVIQHDRTYRHVLRFRHAPAEGKRQLDADHNGPLALAARCTSSFPGAFPPVSIGEFAADLRADPTPAGPRTLDQKRLQKDFFPEYESAGDADSTYFVDGGVLDNAPFDHVIDQISSKRADREVLRQIIYIEPDPSPLPPAGTARAKDLSVATGDDEPGWLATIWATRATIPWHEPILAQLLRIRDLNIRIQEVGDIAKQQMATVTSILDVAAAGWRAKDLTYERLGELAKALHEQAVSAVGLQYGTYCRLKLDTVAIALAEQVAGTYNYPPGSSQASFTQAVIAAWVRQHIDAWVAMAGEELAGFLQRLDVAYRERRLRFVLQGLNDLYGDPEGPTRQRIDDAKATLWEALEGALGLARRALQQLPEPLHAFLDREALIDETIRDDPKRFARAHHDDIKRLIDAYGDQLQALTRNAGRQLWDQFLDKTAGWSDRPRLGLVARYIGFPIWDTLVFPIIALADLPQLHPIGVTRFSPLDATAFHPPQDDGSKLEGVRWHHFGAFFERAWRENDYLWGRIDGATLLFKLLHSALPEGADIGDERHLLATAAGAVLASETGLGEVEDLRENLRQQADALYSSSQHRNDAHGPH